MKAPAVVRRPVPSISCRSMIRTGETVLVPIGSSLTRCGISDPVSTFPVSLRRVLTEDVIASNSNDRASQQMVEDAATVVAGLSRGLFQRHTVLAANDLF